MVGTNHFKKGLKISIKDEPYVIVDFQHIKPGKGNQFTRTKLRHLIKGSLLDLTVRSGEKFKEPDVMYKDMSFLYREGEQFYFMDSSTYDQITISKSAIGVFQRFLTENMVVKVCFFNDQAVGIELAKTVLLKVTDTEPGFKGNTVTNVTKPATVETGWIVQVPPHINEGDTVKVNTESSTYIERVKLEGRK